MNRQRQKGVAAVEFALVISLLLLILGGTIEFGRLFWHYDALVKASRDGARYLSKNLDPAGAHALVRSAVTAAGLSVDELPDADIHCECGYGAAGEVLNEVVSWSTNCTSAMPKYVRALIDFTFTVGGLMPLATVMPGTNGPVWQNSIVLTIHPATAMRYAPPLN